MAQLSGVLLSGLGWVLLTDGKQKERGEEINVEQGLKIMLGEGIIYSVFKHSTLLVWQ